MAGASGSDLIAAPTRLSVVYDDQCNLCRRCRAWLEQQSQLVPLSFAPASDPAVRSWAGDWIPVGDELVVVADSGAVWVGPDAFITCLWALSSHRKLSQRLQAPGMHAVAKQAFHALSAGRGVASILLGAVSEVDECGAGLCTPVFDQPH